MHEPAATAEAAEDAPATGVQLALFRAGGARLAVPAERTWRFVRLTRTVPIPLSPPSVIGVANANGKLVTVLDVALMLGLQAAGEQGRHDCLVVHFDGDLVGLAADALDGVVEVPREQLRGAGGDGRGNTLGTCDHAGQLVTVLDVDRLIQAVEAGLSRT